MKRSPIAPDIIKAWARRGKLLIAIAAAVLLFREYEVSTHCIHQSRVFDGPRECNYDAVVDVDACEGFGGSVVVRVKLQSKSIWPSETSVFAYDLSDQPPVIAWITPDQMEVDVGSIESLDDIQYQLHDAHGIKISYNIRHVGYPIGKPNQPN
jgi:hypothetical protein